MNNSVDMNITSVNPNEIQVGGDHYKSEYQHWDFVPKFELDYFQGCATKYISRWRKKNGIQDLKKALHYVCKFQEKRSDQKEAKNIDLNNLLFYAASNDLLVEDALAIKLICLGDYSSLRLAASLIEYQIEHINRLAK
jgi:hypothetical protein